MPILIWITRELNPKFSYIRKIDLAKTLMFHGAPFTSSDFEFENSTPDVYTTMISHKNQGQHLSSNPPQYIGADGCTNDAPDCFLELHLVMRHYWRIWRTTWHTVDFHYLTPGKYLIVLGSKRSFHWDSPSDLRLSAVFLHNFYVEGCNPCSLHYRVQATARALKYFVLHISCNKCGGVFKYSP